MTKTESKSFDAKALAAEHKTYIEKHLNIALDDNRCFVTLKAVYKMAKGLVEGERLPRTSKIRFDHYRSIIRFMAVAMLWTDKATNTVVALDTKSKESKLIPAGNSFFQGKLNMERSTLDGVIASVKRLGWYASVVRYQYKVAGAERIFKAKTSIKCVFTGFYEFFGMMATITKKVKQAKQYAQRAIQKATNAKLGKIISTGASEFHDFGYGKQEEARHIKRRTRRVQNLSKTDTKTVTNQKGHTDLIKTQVELADKGYTPKQIADQLGSQAFKDCDDIPY